jgi:hypothetical protein
MLPLPWCVIQRNGGRELQTRHLQDHHGSRRDPMPAQSADDVYLCLWRWHRQFGAGDHVGSNQRKNRKCAASIAIRRSIHVRSGHNPAATRSEIQDDCLSSLSKLTKPLIPLLPLAFPKSRLTSQQIGRAMFDRSETWLSESGFGSKDIRAAVLTYLE